MYSLCLCVIWSTYQTRNQDSVTAEMTRGLENLSCEDGLRAVVVQPREDLRATLPYLKGTYREARVGQSHVVIGTRGNGFK